MAEALGNVNGQPLPDPAVLGRILLLQSTIHGAPDERRLAEMLVHGLAVLPGVTDCILCLEGITTRNHGSSDAPVVGRCPLASEAATVSCSDCAEARFPRCEGWQRYELRTSHHEYGSVFLSVQDQTSFAPYLASIGNTANLAALVIENDRSALELNRVNRGLDELVSERTRQLQESEERLREAQKVARIGSFESDTYGDEIWWSRGLWHLFGLDPARFTPTRESLVELIHPDDRDRCIAALRTDLTSKAVLKGECRVRHADGEWRYVELISAARLDDNGKVAGLRGTVQDITERKRAEEELAASEERFRTICENAPVLIDGFDETGRCVLWNKECRETFGWTIDEINSHGDALALFYPDPAVHDEALRTVTSDPDGHFREWCPVTKDGKTLITLWANFRLPDGKVFNLGHDVTERRRMESELRRAHSLLEQRVEERTAELKVRTDEAERLNREMAEVMKDLQSSNAQLKATTRELTASNKELDSFSYSVSHDLRSPLRHIDAFTKLLIDNEKERLGPESARYLERIVAAVGRMGRLVDDLLEFSRMGRAQLHLARVDSREIVEAVRSGLCLSPEDRRINWEIGDLPAVQADGSLLRQVWENLIGNAIKYTGLREEAHIEIGATRDGGKEESTEVTFFIRDNGVGFDPEYAHKLFGVFERLHGKEEFEGTGIGLANVRRIVERHGGRVWAEGEPDRGATFYFTLQEAK